VVPSRAERFGSNIMCLLFAERLLQPDSAERFRQQSAEVLDRVYAIQFWHAGF
jgi:hypothetical protein